MVRLVEGPASTSSSPGAALWLGRWPQPPHSEGTAGAWEVAACPVLTRPVLCPGSWRQALGNPPTSGSLGDPGRRSWQGRDKGRHPQENGAWQRAARPLRRGPKATVTVRAPAPEQPPVGPEPLR